MISKVIIKNIYGIKSETTLDFEQGYAKDSQVGFGKGIIEDFGKKIMLTPILLGKNASGKSSIIRAVSTTLSTNSVDDFIDLFYSNIEFDSHIMQYSFLSECEKSFTNTFSDLIKVPGESNSLYKQIWNKAKTMEDSEKNKVLAGFSYAANRNSMEVINARTAQMERMVNIDDVMADGPSWSNIDDLMPEYNVRDINPFSLFENSLIELLSEKIDDIEYSGKLSSNYLLARAKNDYVLCEIQFSSGDIKRIYLSKDRIEFVDTFNKIEFRSTIEEYIQDKVLSIKNSESLMNEYYFFLNIYTYLKGDSPLEDVSSFMESVFNSNLLGRKNNIKKTSIPSYDFSVIDDEKIRMKIRRLRMTARSHNVNRRVMQASSSHRSNINAFENIQHRTSFNWLESLLKRLDPSIQYIELTHSKNIKIINNDDERVSINDLSYGTLKIILIIDEILSSDARLVLVDEIENGLNISLIKLIVSLLTNSSINHIKKQVIFTTHNPLILDQSVINPNNAFINLDGTFKKPKDIDGIINRTEDYDKIFNPKNYSNELFWFKKSTEEFMYNPNTVKHSWIEDLIDDLEDIRDEEL